MNPRDDALVLELIRIQDRLRGFLRCLLIRPEDLDDVLQETNRVVLKKSSSFRAGTDFWAWTCQIARYEALSYHRRQRRDRHRFDTEMIEDLASRAEAYLRHTPEHAQALEQCLKLLSESQEQLIKSRYTEGHSLQSIAESLRRPVGSIRQTLYRIRQQLRTCIEGKLSEATP